MNGADLLWRILVCEVIILLAALVVLVVLLVWWLLRKLVVVPTLTVAVDKTSYFREETVKISGTLLSNGNPLANKTVGLVIQPPIGDAYSLPSVTTDAEGKFASTWVVPDDAVAGSYRLVAASVGVTAATTFTLESA